MADEGKLAVVLCVRVSARRLIENKIKAGGQAGELQAIAEPERLAGYDTGQEADDAKAKIANPVTPNHL